MEDLREAYARLTKTLPVVEQRDLIFEFLYYHFPRHTINGTLHKSFVLSFEEAPKTCSSLGKVWSASRAQTKPSNFIFRIEAELLEKRVSDFCSGVIEVRCLFMLN